MRVVLRSILVLGMLCSTGIGIQESRADDPMIITFLTWKPNQPGVWKQLIERFNRENPNIQVRVQVAPHSSTEYHAIISQRLKNKDKSVDVFFMDVIWPPQFANAGWALDLTSRFTPQQRQKFLHGPISANTYGGKIYGVPCYLGAGLFYYRKDLLKKYHFKPPETWSAMLSQGKVIIEAEKNPGLNIYSAQFKQYEGLVCNMLEFIWSNGGSVFDSETGKATLAMPPAEQAVTFVRDHIIGKAAPRGALNYEEPESLDLFIQGKAIFHRNWPYAWAVMNDPKGSRIAGKVGVGPLPAFHGHSSASTLGGWQFGINRYSRHPKQAWQFVKFMTSHETQKFLAINAAVAPTRRSVYHDPDVQKKMPHLEAFLPAFEKARPRPLSPVYPMISQALQRFFSRSIVGEKTNIQEMIQTTSGEIEKLFKLGSMIRK
jgi:multiple sugar transport system substrate-binding protein